MTSPAPARHRRRVPRLRPRRRIARDLRPTTLERDLGLVLARAFQDDPMFAYVEPDPEVRRAALPWLLTCCVMVCRRERREELPGQGAALWMSPPGSHLTVQQVVRSGLWRAPQQLGWPATRRLLACVLGGVGAVKEALDPDAWYLFILGVDPGHQGKGISRTLIQPVLELADATGTRCRLETYNPTNVAIYERFGFEVVDTRAPLGTPRQWLMVRQPRPLA